MREPIEDLYELSPMQQGMLFHTLEAPGAGLFCEQITCLLLGRLDPAAFGRAWAEIALRHPVLRTAFHWQELEKPLQVVHREVEIPLATGDWSGLPPAEAEARLAALLADDRLRGFDLALAPLLRLGVFRLDDHRHRFVMTSHHLLFDGWCVPLIVQEVLEVYEALLGGGAPTLPPPPRPYRDYIAWLQEQDRAAPARFWQEQLAGFACATPLPFDRAPGLRRAGSAEISSSLTEEATGALQELARARRLTLNTLMQGAWALLLARSSGADEVVFGATVSGRPPELEGVETMIGLFINTLPVRVRVGPDEELDGWLRGLQEHHAAARRFEHTPLVEVQGWSGVRRGTPLFESLVVFENFPLGGIGEAGANADESEGPSRLEVDDLRFLESSNYPLTLTSAVRGQRLRLRLFYAPERCDCAAAARILLQTETLLTGILAGLSAPPAAAGHPAPVRLRHIGQLSEAERHQLLVEWSTAPAEVTCLPAGFSASAAVPPAGGASCCSADAGLFELFAAQAARTPGAVAIVAGERRLTYAELAASSRRLAARLRRQGVGPEIRVAVCGRRTPELLAALLGVLCAGGAYVPLDPAWPRARLAYMLEDSAAALLLTEAELLSADAFSGTGGEHPAGIPVLNLAGEPLAHSTGRPEPADRGSASFPPADPRQLAYVIYTSGSTGQPKGVAVAHASAAALVRWAARAYSPRELAGVFAGASVCFDMSVFEIFAPLACGGAVVLADNALALPTLPSRGEVTLLSTVPGAAAALVREPGGIPPGVISLNVGGEAVHATLVRDILAASSAERLLNVYGPTEDTVYSTWYLTDGGAAGDPPIGRPITGGCARLLDGHLAPVAIGVTGELYLGGEGLARGYLGRPALTALRFRPDPCATRAGGSRLYHTGDLARWLSDGNLEFLGRADQQVKLNGFRIELGEIEAALLRHPAVAEAAAVLRPREPGAGALDTGRLVAYIAPLGGEARPKEPQSGDAQTKAPQSGDAPSLARDLSFELRAWLRESLPDFMVPAAIVVLPELPRTSTGKVDRAALPDPERGAAAPAGAFSEPASEMERLVAAVFAEVLGVARAGRDDNFFDLGGQSLLLIRAASLLGDRLGRPVPVVDLFHYSTVSTLALYLAEGEPEPLPPPTDLDQTAHDRRRGQGRRRNLRQSAEAP